MKKIICLALAFALTLISVTGCKKDNEIITPPPKPPITEEFADPNAYPAVLKDSVEISMGQNYSASSEEQGFGAENAFNDESGRWSTKQSDLTGWIAVEFSSPVTITAFSVREYHENNWSNVSAYDAQVMDDTIGDWVTVKSQDKILDNEIIRLDNKITTGSFRIMVKENKGESVVSLERVAVYGENDNADTYEVDKWFDLPLVSKGIRGGGYLYLAGGYNSVDQGTPAWGTKDMTQSLMIGDKAGEIVVSYSDGKIQTVPLIFGYTMWFNRHWGAAKMPFQGLNATQENKDNFSETLHCYNADAGLAVPFIKLKVRDVAICNIEIIDNKAKPGMPIFLGGYIASKEELLLSGKHSVNTKNKFFRGHTINLGQSYPKTMQENVYKMALATVTCEDDFLNAPDFVYPSNFDGATVKFSGDKFAEILSGVYCYNLLDMNEKTRADGMVDESTQNAPSWDYDGFGTYSENRGQYYGSMFSRNGKSIISQSYTGYLKNAQNAVDYTNKQLMYHRENNLKIRGKQIPGHWGVMINKPLVYSQELVPGGWPTRYTKAAFGNDYQNMGNIEPDGHGLTMMAIYNIWRTSGSSAKWVNDNWTYIFEAADFLDWCVKNPDVSFSENNLIYGESEGGMQTFTMYNNIPCYIGLKMYAEMAIAAGKTQAASSWNALADKMEQGINTVLKAGNKWNSGKFGFFHDPFISQYADYSGYDINDMPQDYVTLSKNTYESDLAAYIGEDCIGPRGIGYDHNIMSQNALLLDDTARSEKFIKNLARLSYAPRLPKPYIVPEGLTFDKEDGLYRRQGDLGNLAQQAESVKTILMTTGLSQVHNNSLKIMPRLPKGWSVDIKDILIPGNGGKINYSTSYPSGNKQEFKFTLNETNLTSIKFRAGAFSKAINSSSATFNGKSIESNVVDSGDSKWVWVELSNLVKNVEYTLEVTVK